MIDLRHVVGSVVNNRRKFEQGPFAGDALGDVSARGEKARDHTVAHHVGDQRTVNASGSSRIDFGQLKS